jgi:hypothetical protein
MDNNNLSQTILQSSEASAPSSFLSSSNDGGFFDNLKNINLTTWLLIILILAFLGLNIFVYLAQGTQTITNIFEPLIKTIFGTAASITGQAVDVSAEGAKAVVAGTAGALESGLTAIQDITPNKAPSSVGGQPVEQPKSDVVQQYTLNKVLNSAQTQQNQQDYQAHEASSSLGDTTGKAGWCYVGEDRGFRSCAQVGANDTCMSGEIFPSHEICMNPSLRA